MTQLPGYFIELREISIRKPYLCLLSYIGNNTVTLYIMSQRKTSIIIFLCLFVFAVYAQYVPDILGNGYLRRTFQMPDDYEGKVVCTLVKKPQLDSVKQAILYIHGYNDYFFQKQLGDSVNAHGYNFYAMDLRKYGRSILPNQNPFFCKSLKEYFADIDTALATIRSEGNERILLMAHSTGGLITPYYLNSKKRGVTGRRAYLEQPFSGLEFRMVYGESRTANRCVCREAIPESYRTRTG